MSIVMRRGPKTVIPDFIDWFEEPFLTLRPYLGQPIRIEDYTEDGHYVVRAELAGTTRRRTLRSRSAPHPLDPCGPGRDCVEGKHRSEFRYGAFSRTLELPPGRTPTT